MTFKTFLQSLLVSTALALLGSSAIAGGTAPGIQITNSIDISFNSGGNTITRANESSVSFMVDRKVDFIVEGQDASSTVAVSLGAIDQQLTFMLVNEGNDASGYDIDVTNTGALGLTYDALGSGAEGTYSVYLGTTPDPVDPADTLYDATGTTNIGDIAPDATVYVKIVAHIPTSAADGDSDSFDVTATALDAGTSTPTTQTALPAINTVDTFFADTGADGVEIDTEAYLVSAPKLSATKTHQLISENLDGSFDCAAGAADPTAEAFIPGACVEYVLSVTNDATASAAAANLALTDALPAGLTFVSVASNSGFDTVSEASGTISASAASLAPGSTASVAIRVSVD